MGTWSGSASFSLGLFPGGTGTRAAWSDLPSSLPSLTHSSCPAELQPPSTCLAPLWTMTGTTWHSVPQQLLAQCLTQQVIVIVGKPKMGSLSFGSLLPHSQCFHLSLHKESKSTRSPSPRSNANSSTQASLIPRGMDSPILSPWLTWKSSHGINHILPRLPFSV